MGLNRAAYSPRKDAQMDTSWHDAPGDGPAGRPADEPATIEEIEVEDLSVDGICGVY